ncbi:MAG: glycosyltransferase family 4 protein [Nitrospiraceae bacterium]|nr:glycosyltransferase family 4 protein [Nitrospiraceae bacterium]
MNIVIINHYAGSPGHGMEYRHYYLARQWTGLGHRVCIVAASYSHLRRRQPDTGGMMTREIVDGIQYLWLKTPQYRGNGARRALNMLTFALLLVFSTKKILRICRPGLVVASSPHPFIIFGADRIARASNARLTFEVRDLWPLTLTELGGISERHPFIVMMQKAENIAYRVSDRVISLLPKADSYMREHDLRRGKFVYIPNGIDGAEWQSSNKAGNTHHMTALSEIKRQEKFIVGYAGAHGPANELHALIDAAALMQSCPVVFVLIGHGPEKKQLRQRAGKKGLQNVVFLDSVPKSDIPGLLTSMDILYIGLKNEPLFRFGVSPNKLMDYMMAARPVIHAINAGNDMVSESNCGISIAPGQPEAIRDAVIKLINMTAAERNAMGARGRDYVLAHHDFRVLARRFFEAVI